MAAEENQANANPNHQLPMGSVGSAPNPLEADHLAAISLYQLLLFPEGLQTPEDWNNSQVELARFLAKDLLSSASSVLFLNQDMALAINPDHIIMDQRQSPDLNKVIEFYDHSQLVSLLMWLSIKRSAFGKEYDVISKDPQTPPITQNPISFLRQSYEFSTHFDDDTVATICAASSLIHDIGKIRDLNFWAENRRLEDTEYVELKEHATSGLDTISESLNQLKEDTIYQGLYELIKDAVEEHHAVDPKEPKRYPHIDWEKTTLFHHIIGLCDKMAAGSYNFLAQNIGNDCTTRVNALADYQSAKPKSPIRVLNEFLVDIFRYHDLKHGNEPEFRYSVDGIRIANDAGKIAQLSEKSPEEQEQIEALEINRQLEEKLPDLIKIITEQPFKRDLAYHTYPQIIAYMMLSPIAKELNTLVTNRGSTKSQVMLTEIRTFFARMKMPVFPGHVVAKLLGASPIEAAPLPAAT